MKRLILLILLIFTSNIICAQTIKNLKTFKEVATFLEKEINKEYTFEAIFEGEDEIDIEDFNEVIKKIDLDANGTIDLVVDYFADLIIVLDNGNNKYQELKDIKYSMDFLSLIEHKGKPFFIRKIQMPTYDTKYSNEIIALDKSGKVEEQTSKKDNIITESGIQYKVDTLEVKYGSLLELTKNVKNEINTIKEIHFKATSCFGSCPVFELKLTSDGNLEYIGKQHTNFIGRKNIKLNPEKVTTLFGIIQYTNVKKLKDRYAVNATDYPSGILKVFFENGEVKEIYDYGRQGTYNLEVIYDKFMHISNGIK